jgi:hypothetical protein
MLAVAALALAVPGTAAAQTTAPMPTGAQPSPAPVSSPAPGVMTMSPMPPSMLTPAPSTTSQPSSNATPAPSGDATSAPSRSAGGQRTTGGNAKVKPIKNGALTRSQVVYGLTHQIQAAKQLAKMKTINFDNLRVYKLPSSLKSMVKLSDAETRAITTALLGSGVLVAQTTPNLPSTNGNNSPIQYLRDVLANINVSNALNNLNVLNNSNVNVNLALSNVLNNNKISIGQVVGLYIGGGGIITTITN